MYKVGVYFNIWYVLDKNGHLVAVGSKRHVEDYLDYVENNRE